MQLKRTSQALARQKRWPDIDALFKKKSMIGLLRVKLPLPPAHVIDLLAKHQAPADVSPKLFYSR